MRYNGNIQPTNIPTISFKRKRRPVPIGKNPKTKSMYLYPCPYCGKHKCHHRP